LKFINYLLLERNIVNTDSIDRVIDSMIQMRPHTTQQMKKWLETNLRNYLLREYEPVEDVTNTYKIYRDSVHPWTQSALDRGDKLLQVNLTPASIQQFYHVLDYFIASPNLNISRISVPEAIRQSEEWTKQLNKKASGNDDLEGIKEVRKYPDGTHWVEVFSKKALDREGKLMSHCVGSYCEQVSSGSTKIYSLRDKKNEPHCTIEVRNRIVQQIKGHGNGSVDKKYRSYVIDFIEKPVEKTKFNDLNDLQNIGCIRIHDNLYTESDSDNPIVKKYIINYFIDFINPEFRQTRYLAYGERKSFEAVFDALDKVGFPYDIQTLYNDELIIDKVKELEKYLNKIYGKTLFDLFEYILENDEV